MPFYFPTFWWNKSMQNATSCFQNDYVTSCSALKRAAPKQMAFWSRHFWKTNLHFFTFYRGFSGVFLCSLVQELGFPQHMHMMAAVPIWFKWFRKMNRTATGPKAAVWLSSEFRMQMSPVPTTMWHYLLVWHVDARSPRRSIEKHQYKSSICPSDML